MNFVFGIKHANDKKVNSHKWFFHGICKYLQPKYTMMLDIGTEAEEDSIVKLYKYMQLYKHCGGCCGEIEVDLRNMDEKDFSFKLIQWLQYFEYKINHTPAKGAESAFGFCSVLPGAYSLFRYKAIRGKPMN